MAKGVNKELQVALFGIENLNFFCITKVTNCWLEGLLSNLLSPIVPFSLLLVCESVLGLRGL
jgi:hypothetical protein